MKRTFVRLSRAKSANCWLRSGEKSSISKGSRPTCTRVIANCKIDFARHVFTAHHCRADEANPRNGRDLAPRSRLRLTRSEVAIHEFGRHRHHDQSKNPAHHTVGSKLTRRRAVLKFNLDAIYRSIMQTDGVSPTDISRCSLSSLTASAVLARSSFPSSAR